MIDPGAEINRIEAEDLADLLDEVLPAGSDSLADAAQSDNPLVLTAAAVAAQDFPQPSLEAMARMQSRMLVAQSNLAHGITTHTPQRQIIHLTWRSLAAVASVVLVLFISSVLVQASSPNSVLYPAKRALEKVEVKFASVTGDEASVRLNLAEARVNEALALITQDEFEPELIEEAAVQIEAVATIVSQSGVASSAEMAGRAASLNRLLDLVADEASNREISTFDMLRTIMAIHEIDEAGALQSLVDGGMDNNDEADSDPAHVAAPEIMPEATESPEETIEASDVLTVIADGIVNLRKGPGLDFEVVMPLDPGTQVEVMDTSADGQWIQVRLAGNIYGWVADFLLGTSLPSNNGSGANSSLTGGGNNGQPGSTNNGSEGSGGQDFGCGQPGNQCNAPGRQDNPNAGRK